MGVPTADNASPDLAASRVAGRADAPAPVRLLVFAHTPPPHHGQSYMVKLMLDGFGGDALGARGASGAYGVICYHVNAQLSSSLEDIGELRFGKALLLWRYCLQAIWCRFRHGVRNLYYVPAPGKKSALYRDWLVMLICRPVFSRIIFHWHAAGLPDWLETHASPWVRAVTGRLLRRVDLSIALTRYNEINARRLQPKQVRVVNNGIPDPCPDFATTVLPRRAARVAARRALLAGQPAGAAPAPAAGDDPQVVHVLFLAQCTREKGVFDTLAGAALAQAKLRAAGSPLTLSLLISGEFVTAAERAQFLEQLARAKHHLPVEVLGFVSGEQKRQVLARADVFCFPTYYRNENQPLNLLEALAFGLPIITTRWRSVHEALPPGALGVVDPQQPAQIAEALLAALSEDSAAASRAQFLQHFTVERHLEELARAIRSVAVPG